MYNAAGYNNIYSFERVTSSDGKYFYASTKTYLEWLNPESIQKVILQWDLLLC